MTKFIVGFITSLMLTMPSLSLAQHRHGHNHFHHHHHHRYNYNNAILGAAVLGGVVTYVMTRPEPAVVYSSSLPSPVIVQPQADVIIDGVAYKKQVMLINGVYQEVLVKM